jgi:peptidoglycan LD-endopeptidase LytH
MRRASRGSPLIRLPYVAGVLVILLAFAQPSFVSADTRAQLNAAKKRLSVLRKELQPLRDQARAVHSEVLSLNVRISQATVQVEALTTARAEAQAELDRSRKEAARLQESLNVRARDAYIRGPAGALELVLESSSLIHLAERVGFLEVLSEADANVADGLRVERQQIAEFRAQLRRYLDEKNRLLERLEKDRVVFEAKQAELEAAREALAKKVEEATDAVANLEQKLQRELIQQYGITTNLGPPLKADGPFWACPVDQPRSYVDDFGAPRVGHTHQGNDIFAPSGTAIRAPFEGTAEEGYDGLGGIAVHVYASANADYVYNAHLSRHVGVDGQHVQPGTIIGAVGNTGNAVGTSPHDHFEYHPGGGSAVSPYLYLNEVCGVGGFA